MGSCLSVLGKVLKHRSLAREKYERRILELEEENTALKEEVAMNTIREGEVDDVLRTMQDQIDGLIETVNKLEGDSTHSQREKKRKQMSISEKRDVDKKLMEACQRGSLVGTVDLLERGASVDMGHPLFVLGNIHASTALHCAAFHGHLSIVKALINHGAAVQAKTPSKHIRPLHAAALEGHLRVVQTLVHHGAKVNSRTNANLTPLHMAAVRGHIIVVEALVKCGARVDARADELGMPLHMASFEGHLPVVQALLSHGASVNATVDECSTPLHFAAAKGHLPVVMALVVSGADTSAEDYYGNTAREVARENNHSDIVKFLDRKS